MHLIVYVVEWWRWQENLKCMEPKLEQGRGRQPQIKIQKKSPSPTAGYQDNIRVIEIEVKGLKRKSLRRETPQEKADRDRLAKQALIDSLWRAGARMETAAAAKRKEKEILDRKEKVKIQPK